MVQERPTDVHYDSSMVLLVQVLELISKLRLDVMPVVKATEM